MTYYMRDLFTGDDMPVPARHYDEPSEAWVEGWNASMYGGLPTNSYDPYTTKVTTGETVTTRRRETR